MNNLVIVESPTKAKTLSRFLGNEYRIEASMGHIRDLPKKELGVDTEHNFKPDYVVSSDRKKRVSELKKLARESKKIILATDPDREGEAIAWHISQLLGGKSKPERIVFHEITDSAIKEALNHPRDLDLKLVDAQQARRILDRLVGYKLSPLLWQKVRKGLSAGRVQSVAVKLIVEKEREINKFNSREYWELEAELKKINDPLQGKQNSSKNISENNIFKAKLISKNREKVEIRNKEEANIFLKELEGAEYKVIDILEKELKKYPYPPFMTSTLQQAAGNRFGWSAKRTMQIAQQLFEEGFITYHRTDSFNLSNEIIIKTRDYILKNFGPSYLPESPKIYKAKSKVAQEAHEAIRPTNIEDFSNIKEKIFGELGREAMKLYDIIWKRLVSCQMNEAIYNQTTVDISSHNTFIFRASGLRIKFDGWKKIFEVEEGENAEEKEKILPCLDKDEILSLLSLIPSQHFTEPPARFTESSLIKSLEEKGIGRPSTYAPIISTILDRQYVEKVERKFNPTPLGITVNDFIEKYFPNIVDYSFTADMEDKLDSIARGESKWEIVIKDFYDPFMVLISNTSRNALRVKVMVEETDEKCDLCNSPLVVRIGKFGKFLACSRFPKCNFTKPFIQKTNLICPKCNGNIILKRTKRGKQFYGCSNYPNCDFASWTKPALPINSNGLGDEKVRNDLGATLDNDKVK